MNIRSRVSRLEVRLIPTTKGRVKEMTWDELQVRFLSLSRVIVHDLTISLEQRNEAALHIEEIEADIRETAVKQASPEYKNYMDQCRSQWRQRSGRDDYIPALSGSMGEHCDWDAPNVMRRRATLRAMAEIQELLP